MRENVNGKTVFTGFERTSNRSLSRRKKYDERSGEEICGQSKLGKYSGAKTNRGARPLDNSS